ncbi:hypothetical protein PVAP13_2KG223632 [Panicum virgatum]|uniref:Uncharacterized protein n=1 Tax=Panicum virgatum TaxID=38727 RepID=A0A8T0W2U5_PANVG|nr:hypothetical protein PVAP13_2KG223632 [Panicum virgatum]
MSQRHSKNQEHVSSLLAVQALFAVRRQRIPRHAPTYATCRRGQSVPISREEPPVKPLPRRRRPAAGEGPGGDVCSASLLSSPEPNHPAGERVKGERKISLENRGEEGGTPALLIWRARPQSTR